MRVIGWPAALAILAAAAVTELLPLASLPLTDSRGFLYVTLHFILLPLACVCHVVCNTFGIGGSEDRPGATPSLSAASSVIVSAGYLLAIAFWPMPFADLFFK